MTTPHPRQQAGEKTPRGGSIRHPALSMRTAFFENGGAVGLDENTPARIMARKEALHPTDEDFDADLAPDDDGETIDLAGIKSIPRDALRTLLRFLVPNNSVSAKKRWRMAQLRVALLAQMLDIDGIGQKSFQQLGDELGCSRALLSLYSLRIVDGLTLNKAPNGKCRASRLVYKKTSTEAHRRAGHRMTADKLAEDG
jgi:hypothetical protein